MVSIQTRPPYPQGVIEAPKDRHGRAAGANTGLPTGTELFSADNHGCLA
jgi:hypothetical protein